MRSLAVIIGALSLTTAADAAVVVIRLPNLGVPLYQNSFPIDLDVDGVDDLTITSTPGEFTAFAASHVRFQVIGSSASPLAVGDIVGATALAGGVWDTTLPSIGNMRVCTNFLCLGTWPKGTFVTEDPLTGFLTIFPESGYLGVEITKPDGVHYGWVDVGVLGFDPTGRIYGWGYETQAGVPVQISVPEPSLGALFLIGSTATLLRRRRRS